MGFQCVEEVRCHHWVAEEEAREVDSNHVIVALLSVEFEGETSNVSEKVRRALGADGCRHSGKERSTLAHLAQEACLAPLADIMSHFKVAMSSLALCVSSSLRDPLAVKLLDLIEELEILQKHRASCPRSQNMYVVVDRVSSTVSKHIHVQRSACGSHDPLATAYGGR